MKQATLSLIFFLTVLIAGHAQNNVGIGTIHPDPSAVLELSSSNKGFLVPRLPDTSSIPNPANGLVFYNEVAKCLYLFRSGLGWIDLCSLGSGQTGTTGTSSGEALIGRLIGFDFNTTNAQAIPLTGGANFMITNIVLLNASTAPSNATGFQVWTTAVRGAAGSYHIADVWFLTLTNPSTYKSVTTNGSFVDNQLVGTTVYASLTTANGSPCTVDVYVYGIAF